MNDYALILNSVSSLFAAVDRLDWRAVQDLMTDPFHVDYSSYGGGEPSQVTPSSLTQSWAAHLPLFDAIHHQIGNQIVQVEGDKAQVQCHGMASHYLADAPGGDVQFIVGTYDLSLIRKGLTWKLSAMRFNFRYASGNADLGAEATKRRAARS